MFWMAIGATLVAAIVVTAIIMLVRRPGDDLGAVSVHWIAEHRVDAP